MTGLLLAALLAAPPASAGLPGVHLGADIPALKHSPRCILHAVAQDLADRIGRYRGPEMEARIRAAASMPGLPALRPESRTPLAEFAEAAGPQGADGAVFGNLYAVAANKIFLIDDPAYYARFASSGRTMEDSLAHEYMHYLQVAYLGYAVEHLGSDEAEGMAVDYQASYRERYAKTGAAPPCP